MATITKPNTFTAGTTIFASEHNDNFDTIYNDYNGNILNVNIGASAAIAESKMTFASSGGHTHDDYTRCNSPSCYLLRIRKVSRQ